MAWNPLIPTDFYLPLAFVFTLVGIFAFLWLLFFVETSHDLPRRDRIIGLAIRLIVMAITLGPGVFFITLVNII